MLYDEKKKCPINERLPGSFSYQVFDLPTFNEGQLDNRKQMAVDVCAHHSLPPAAAGHLTRRADRVDAILLRLSVEIFTN